MACSRHNIILIRLLSLLLSPYLKFPLFRRVYYSEVLEVLVFFAYGALIGSRFHQLCRMVVGGHSLFTGALITIYTLFAIFIITFALCLFFLAFFVAIIFLSEIGTIAGQVVLNRDSRSFQLFPLLIGQLALEDGGILLEVFWVELIFAALFTIVLELALEVFTVFSDHVQYFKAGQHFEDFLTIVIIL